MAPTSVNKQIYFITGMLKASAKYFRSLARHEPPKIDWEKASKQARRRIITEDEREKLLTYLRYEGRHPGERIHSRERRHLFADMFEIALGTSMRWGEMARVEWSFIDFDRRIIYLPEEITKTGVGRNVYLNSRVMEILGSRAHVNQYVFPGYSGTGCERMAHHAFKRYCAKLGLPFSLEGFTLHTTRHTAVSEMLRLTGDFAGVQQQAGHSDRTMTALYAHAKDDTMHLIAESLVKK